MIIPYNFVKNQSAEASSNSLTDTNLVQSFDNWFTGDLDYQRELENLNRQNIYNSAEAQKSREWQERQWEIERLYNSAEAEKNRLFQLNMSNTAYQRAVEDMKKAGLNPYLAYSQGGASVGSGATASTSAPTGVQARSGSAHSNVKASKGIGALLSAVLSLASSATTLAVGSMASNTNLARTALDASTKMNVADTYASARRDVAEIYSRNYLRRRKW